MGTKNEPGQFDCYTTAAPNEPIFVLLGRDKHAPLLVQLWASLRQFDGEDQDKVDEARRCATAMATYCGNSTDRQPLTIDRLSDAEMASFHILAQASEAHAQRKG